MHRILSILIVFVALFALTSPSFATGVCVAHGGLAMTATGEDGSVPLPNPCEMQGGKRVMLGFITTKTPELESIDDLKRRFDEAARHADLDQLGIAPQCGFASTEEGNALTADQQRRQLELVVRTAEAIWGGVDC